MCTQALGGSYKTVSVQGCPRIIPHAHILLKHATTRFPTNGAFSKISSSRHHSQRPPLSSTLQPTHIHLSTTFFCSQGNKSTGPRSCAGCGSTPKSVHLIPRFFSNACLAAPHDPLETGTKQASHQMLTHTGCVKMACASFIPAIAAIHMHPCTRTQMHHELNTNSTL